MSVIVLWDRWLCPFLITHHHLHDTSAAGLASGFAEFAMNSSLQAASPDFLHSGPTTSFRRPESPDYLLLRCRHHPPLYRWPATLLLPTARSPDTSTRVHDQGLRWFNVQRPLRLGHPIPIIQSFIGLRCCLTLALYPRSPSAFVPTLLFLTVNSGGDPSAHIRRGLLTLCHS
ncbi:hypothetical protein FB45DRAFT_1112166 [Roridomyces roridus]|uniref:Uncharacterized protein n=1 Tax=Roridomyces roridus TaxID=1738132 RepID=A0AAD7FBA1_9AGAR|nr:hypothetical protein FB45DRAFT_1112166 [Roridomyces roridus]